MTGGDLALHGRWCWAGGELHAVRWGDETAMYHESSASTHLLDADTGLVVAALHAAGQALGTTEAWQLAFGEPPQAEGCLALQESLDGLVRVGLVTRTAS